MRAWTAANPDAAALSFARFGSPGGSPGAFAPPSPGAQVLQSPGGSPGVLQSRYGGSLGSTPVSASPLGGSTPGSPLGPAYPPKSAPLRPVLARALAALVADKRGGFRVRTGGVRELPPLPLAHALRAADSNALPACESVLARRRTATANANANANAKRARRGARAFGARVRPGPRRRRRAWRRGDVPGTPSRFPVFAAQAGRSRHHPG